MGPDLNLAEQNTNLVTIQEESANGSVILFRRSLIMATSGGNSIRSAEVFVDYRARLLLIEPTMHSQHFPIPFDHSRNQLAPRIIRVGI
jgi:hypothetical protein